MAGSHVFGFAKDSREVEGYAAELEATIESVKKMKKLGIRVLVGGDYGLNITPHGTYAKDLEYFVKFFGFSQFEALRAATKHGGLAFMPDGGLGTLTAGNLADVVLIGGNPLEEIQISEDEEREMETGNPDYHFLNRFFCFPQQGSSDCQNGKKGGSIQVIIQPTVMVAHA